MALPLPGAEAGVTSRRGGLVATGGCASEAPHMPQNRYSGLLSYPQCVQRTYIVSSIAQYLDGRKAAAVGREPQTILGEALQVPSQQRHAGFFEKGQSCVFFATSWIRTT